ncbi:DUF5694 domain-containing protein [Flavobacterium cerinum]|uniref:DUF5694 domain-containing protein n=1 Tax=Flavobacterium cerinum TaxID=2502784 RepID=A0ABY5ISP6_9FLAO|nr:DUF5694 domain-containing protein [Flavobacterium cerinum]UUC45172.1 DUF5694 domain-containing protein [Flavobacterium cerinum]
MKTFWAICFILISFFGFSQEKINVLLIGTYHFNNPGHDAVKMKERNILTPESQKELEQLTDLIKKKFNPDKVFVENVYAKREGLNDMYQKYLKNEKMYNPDTLKNDFRKRFYSENEMFQLGFRLAKKAKNKAIYSIDDRLEFRYDKVMKRVKEDEKLNKKFEALLSESGKNMNECMTQPNLKEVLICLNNEEQAKRNKGFYINFVNALDPEERFGSTLVADWYKRNLTMYSYFQNQVADTDKNVVILVGVGHSSMLKDFILHDARFNLIEFKDLYN